MIIIRTSIVFKLFLLIISLLLFVPGYSQSDERVYKEVNDNYEEILKVLGNDQVLSTGIFFENTYRKDLGHPYFREDKYTDGSIVIRNKKYENLRIKYNIYNQELVIINPEQKPQFAFKPVVEFISEFELGGYHFIKDNTIDSTGIFCQVVYNGKIKCYYVHLKKRNESNHNVKFSAYKYTETSPKRYIIKDDIALNYRSNGSFLKLFSLETAKQIKKYLAENNVKVNKANDETIKQLMEYCDQISNFKTSSDEQAYTH